MEYGALQGSAQAQQKVGAHNSLQDIKNKPQQGSIEARRGGALSIIKGKQQMMGA